MCYTMETVMLMVALAVTSGADWEQLARKTVASRLGLTGETQTSEESKK